jgi:nicotinamide mononucleotide adenylyltransferase
MVKRNNNREFQHCDIFVGRFQGITKGHVEVIKKMNNPIVVIVSGEKSSLIKERNPLTASYRQKLFAKIFPGIQTLIWPNGYIPNIVSFLNDKRYVVDNVFTGKESFTGFVDQLSALGYTTPKVKVVKRYKRLSSSKLRAAIRNRKYNEFLKIVPKQLFSEWKTFKKLV